MSTRGAGSTPGPNFGTRERLVVAAWIATALALTAAAFVVCGSNVPFWGKSGVSLREAESALGPFTGSVFLLCLAAFSIDPIMRMAEKAKPKLDWLRAVHLMVAYPLGVLLTAASVTLFVGSIACVAACRAGNLPFGESLAFTCFGWVFTLIAIALLYRFHSLLDEVASPFRGRRVSGCSPVFLPGWASRSDQLASQLRDWMRRHSTNSDISIRTRSVQMRFQERPYLVVSLGRTSCPVAIREIGTDVCLELSTYFTGRPSLLYFVSALMEVALVPAVVLAGRRLSNEFRKRPDRLEAEDLRALSNWAQRCLHAHSGRCLTLPPSRTAFPDLSSSRDEAVNSPSVPEIGPAEAPEKPLAGAWAPSFGLSRQVVELVALVIITLLFAGWLVRESREYQSLESNPLPQSLSRAPFALGVLAFLGYTGVQAGALAMVLTRIPLALLSLACGRLWGAGKPEVHQKGLWLVVGFLAVCGVWTVMFNLFVAASLGQVLAPIPIFKQLGLYAAIAVSFLAVRWRSLSRQREETSFEPEPPPWQTLIAPRLRDWIAPSRFFAGLFGAVLLGLLLLGRLADTSSATTGGPPVPRLLGISLAEALIWAALVGLLFSACHVARCCLRRSLFPGERTMVSTPLVIAGAAGREAELQGAVLQELGAEGRLRLGLTILRDWSDQRIYLRASLNRACTYLRTSVLGSDICVYWLGHWGKGGLLETLLPRRPSPFGSEDHKILLAATESATRAAAARLGLHTEIPPSATSGRTVTTRGHAVLKRF